MDLPKRKRFLQLTSIIIIIIQGLNSESGGVIKLIPFSSGIFCISYCRMAFCNKCQPSADLQAVETPPIFTAHLKKNWW